MSTMIHSASPPRLEPWSAIPALPGGAPWIGHSVAFGKDPVAFLSEGRRHAGDLFRFRMMGQQVVFACGPRAHESVFKAEDSVLNAGDAYPFMKPIFGPGIGFDAEPEEMDRQMSLLARHLTSTHLQRYPTIMEAEIETCVQAWGDEGEIDLVPAMAELVAAVSSRCLLGPEMRRNMGSDTVGLYRDMAKGLRLAGLLNPGLPLPAFRRRDRARRRIAQELQHVIDTRRNGPNVAHQDMLQALLESRTTLGQPVSDETVIGMTIATTFAGVHNSTGLASWAGVVLLEQADMLPQLLDEQHRIVPAGSPLTAERLHGMELMGRCIREAERLYPPTMVLMRKARKPFVLEGHHVPVGTLVMISPTVAHRMVSAFADPERCDPARYADGRQEHLRPYNLIGFGGGKHRCIGRAFADQEIKAIWSVLLRRFDLRLLGAPHRPSYSTALISEPSAPCVLRYRTRQRG
ncbi:cytochrome P450 [Embleya sp. NPDC127516]|uniref:cytochrome P450 n=1 Tax=Embleya sp. NPDC127516 TaxID=3363990 RepID=UPI0038093700